MSEVKNMPELRFSEFSDAWQIEFLSEYFDVIDGDRGENYPKSHEFLDAGHCLFLNAKNVTKSGFSFSETSFISEAKDSSLRKGKLKREDIVLTTRGSVGFFAFYANEVPYDHLRINSGMVLLRNNSSTVSPEYLYKFSASSNLINQIKRIAFGSAQPQLTVKEIKKFKISFPSKVEQQKIAEFLSSVDKKIEQLTEKHRLLTDYKKGVMQQIFTQKIRFKDEQGNDYPEWEVVAFAKLFSFLKTNSLSRAELVEAGQVANVHYGDIHTRLPSQTDVSKTILPFIRGSIDLSKFTENDFCKNGDLLIADASEDYADIGKAIEITGVIEQKVLGGLHTFLARPSSTKVAQGYSGDVMQIQSVRKQIMRFATGVSVLGISKTNLGKVELPLPCMEEQQKIADFLTAIDQKIDHAQSQLNQTKAFKKGLLQKMFI